ncbi:RloB family protein [Pseudoalteromonas prydzensis]|uniref:RloB family protein n=1 Tax=Pseudoalteromonas prydzensis TaxID=182141 RepID=UPI003704AF61
MSSRKKSGSRYGKKIDIKFFLVSYEGGDDEKKYFESIKSSISRKYENLVIFVPVEKSNVHHSTPSHVLNDLENEAKNLNYNLRNQNVYGYIAFDVDHYFTKEHQKETKAVIKEAKQKSINLIISNPSFDIWPLLHFEQIFLLDDETKNAIKANKNQFIKKRMRKALTDNGCKISNLVTLTDNAMQNNHELGFDLTNPHKEIGTSIDLLIHEISTYLR